MKAGVRVAPRPAAITVVIAVLTLLMTYAGIGLPTRANAAASLLSQGKPATASSTENAGTPASARRRRQHRHPLVERRSATRSGSRSTSAPPPPSARSCCNWEAAYATAFQIQTSADGTTWTTIYTTTTGTGGTQTLNVTGTGRYVRMYGTARATGYGYSLWEFQVYGATGGTGADRGTRQRRAGKPVDRLLHGGRRTRPPRRSTAAPAPAGPAPPADPQWLQVDLGATAHDLPGRAQLGGRLRHGVPDPGVGRRHHLDDDLHHDHRHRRHRRRSTSPAPAATCACTAPPAPPATATRCGSSRSSARSTPRSATRRCSPAPTKAAGDHRPVRS